MSQEKNEKDGSLQDRLDLHPLVSKIKQVASCGTEKDRVSIINEFNACDKLFGQKVSLGDGDDHDFSNNGTDAVYGNLEEIGLAPNHVRIDYADRSNFRLAIRGYLVGLNDEDGVLNYVVDVYIGDSDIATITTPVSSANLVFEADEYVKELGECHAIIGSGVKKESLMYAEDILDLLDSYSLSDLEDYIELLKKKIKKLPAEDFSDSAQYALERVVYLECFSASPDCVIETLAYLERDEDDREWVYRQDTKERFTKEGRVAGVIFEKVESRFIPQLYMYETDTSKVIRIPLDLVSGISC